MKGILINYEYCTGCHSCEVACRNERGLTAGEYGIKLTEVGPYEYTTPIDADTPYEWVYNPTITKACDLCEARTAMGKMPSCVQACQAWCMYYGEVEDLAKKMDGKTRWALYTPISDDARAAMVAEREAMTAGTAEAGAVQVGAGAKAESRTENYGTWVGDMELNIVLRGAEKLEAFLAEFATIDLEAAKKDIEEQIIADEKATAYVLAADKAKDGAAHELGFMAIVMNYDAQGTQLGGGKAYLDKGQEVARKDITLMF